jgi:hypothetical protein
MDSFIDHCVDLIFGNVAHLFGTPIEERFELFDVGLPGTARYNPLRRNRHDADFIVGADWPAKELFDRGPEGRAHFSGLLNRNVGHESPYGNKFTNRRN